VQQAIDVGVPLQTAYNQWTQFEEWPRFMHRLEQVDQKDDCTISFSTKIWGINKTFEAEIIEQYPDERIKWEVASGPSHTGVVTFHQLTDTLTRIELNVDFDPDSLLEKAGRGWRFVKRAVRADLHRFKAFLEMNDEETGAWRGTIEDGEVIEPHEDALEGAGEEEEQEQPQQQREQQRGEDEGQEQEVQDDQGQDEGGQRRRPPRHGRRRPDGSEHDQDQEQALRPPRPPRAPALG
jgi:ribosome-associated toxin RatA of RatAB toxin-antitoxin module